MKAKYIYWVFSVLVMLTYSCKKVDLIADNRKWEFPDEGDFANVRIFHNYSGKTPILPLGTGPVVFMYTNGKKLNGNGLSYAGNWPSPNDYATLPTGVNNFNAVLARLSTTVPQVPLPIAGDTVMSFTETLVKGKHYSLFLVDTAPTMRHVLVNDDLTVPAIGKYKIRLANFINNTVPDTLSLYSRLSASNIVTGIKQREVSPFFEMPTSTLNDTLELRKNNVTMATYFVGGSTAQSFFPVSQRIYTVVCRGRAGVATSPNNLPSAGVLTNR